MMGAQGLFDATATAILSANYLAKKLSNHYPILYTGVNGTIAHECILDIREITRNTGVSVDDIAKRLMDYGFHAPTMSFPVAGTLMIEPTESEDLFEMDRFIEAMVHIRAEISEIESGKITIEDSALRNSPHTAEDIAGEWNRKYSRETAVFPVSGLRTGKYWPPVNRIDGAYGDATGGFRAYKTSALKQLDLSNIDSQGYCFQVDMVRRLLKKGFKIKEVPITFTERTIGTSKMSRNIVLEAFFKIGIWGFQRVFGR